MLVGQTLASYRIQSKFSSKHMGVYVIMMMIMIIIIIIIIVVTGAYMYVLVGQGVCLILLL